MILPSNLSYLHPTYTLRLFHEVIAEFVVCLKVSSQNWEKYSMYEFSDSMYVVVCFNSWCPMKIVTIPIPYSKYRGTIIYIYR